jgi:tetratricopeptide (TPR) repeat protein
MVAALVNLGNAYFARKDYDLAIDQYGKAVKISPDDGRINFNLGSVYSNKGDFEQAVLYYSKAVSLDAEMGDAHHGLAYGLYMLKRYDAAWKHINVAVRLGVDVPKDQIEAMRSKLK